MKKHMVKPLVCVLGVALGGSIASAAPLADIKANGSDTAVTITEGETLSVTVGLDSGDNSGANGDWWLVGSTSSTWYSYRPAGAGWSWQPGFAVTYQGALADLPTYEVLRTTGLAQGSYVFYFGVDLSKDGAVNDPAYYDSISVQVLPGACDFAGPYSGTYTGDESGTWSVVITADGNISGHGYSPFVGTFSIEGTVGNDGALSFVGGTVNFTLATFTGQVYCSGATSGTWYSGFGLSGTFTGSKQ